MLYALQKGIIVVFSEEMAAGLGFDSDSRGSVLKETKKREMSIVAEVKDT